MKAKQQTTQARSHISKLIASHALVAAIFTTPWFIFAYTDLFIILTNPNNTDYPENFASNVYASLSLMSLVAVLVSAISYGYYLFKKSR